MLAFEISITNYNSLLFWPTLYIYSRSTLKTLLSHQKTMTITINLQGNNGPIVIHAMFALCPLLTRQKVFLSKFQDCLIHNMMHFKKINWKSYFNSMLYTYDTFAWLQLKLIHLHLLKRQYSITNVNLRSKFAPKPWNFPLGNSSLVGTMFVAWSAISQFSVLSTDCWFYR